MHDDDETLGSLSGGGTSGSVVSSSTISSAVAYEAPQSSTQAYLEALHAGAALAHRLPIPHAIRVRARGFDAPPPLGGELALARPDLVEGRGPLR